MNDSLDLRNRILKMRESNNLVVTKSNSSNNNLMSKFENSIKVDKPKKFYPGKDNVNDKKLKESIDNNSKKIILNKDSTENKIAKDISNNNEAQFLMLANKFNEAVEVILELSQKVEKLEKKINQDLSQTKIKDKFSFFNVKIFIFVLIIPIAIISFFTLPVDFSLIKLIIIDVLSII